MGSSALQIHWDRISDKNIEKISEEIKQFKKIITNRDQVIKVLKLTPKYIVVEMLNWGCDQRSLFDFRTHFDDKIYDQFFEQLEHSNK